MLKTIVKIRSKLRNTQFYPSKKNRSITILSPHRTFALKIKSQNILIWNSGLKKTLWVK